MSFESPLYIMDHFSSVAQSCLTLKPHGLQHARLPCPTPTPRACSNSHPSSRWCLPTILFSVVPFSSCLQSFPTSGSSPLSQFFASNGQNIIVKVKSESEVAQSCPTLCDPVDCSLPGSSIHRIFHAGVVEWGAKAETLLCQQSPV